MSRQKKKKKKKCILWLTGLWFFKCAHVIPFRDYRHTLFYLKLPQGPYYMTASRKGLGKATVMRRLAWAIAVAYVISTIFSCDGSNKYWENSYKKRVAGW